VFDIRTAKNSKTLVVGTGAGLDALIAALLSEGEIWVTDLNPLAIANTKYLFHLAGMQQRLRTLLLDNIADENGNPLIRVNQEGNPMICRQGGSVVVFDRVIWNMPSYRPHQSEEGYSQKSLIEHWDSAPASLLRRFAQALPEVLKRPNEYPIPEPGGQALIWNVSGTEFLHFGYLYNPIAVELATAGKYSVLSKTAQTYLALESNLEPSICEARAKWVKSLVPEMIVRQVPVKDYVEESTYCASYVIRHQPQDSSLNVQRDRDNLSEISAASSRPSSSPVRSEGVPSAVVGLSLARGASSPVGYQITRREALGLIPLLLLSLSDGYSQANQTVSPDLRRLLSSLGYPQEKIPLLLDEFEQLFKKIEFAKLQKELALINGSNKTGRLISFL
jgi:hypothetical protein